MGARRQRSHRRGRQAPARRQGRCAGRFRRAVVRPRRSGGPGRLRRCRTRRARPCCMGVLAVRKPGAPKIRFEQPALDAKASDSEHLKAISVIEIVNDDMPFLVDSVMGELVDAGARRAVRRPSDPRRSSATRPASSGAAQIGRRDDRRMPRARASSTSMSTRIDDADAPRRSSSRRCERMLAAGPRRGGGLEADAPRASARSSPSSKTIRRRCRPRSIAEAIRFLDWLTAENFTLLGMRDYRACRTTRAGSSRLRDPGLGILRDPRRAGAQPRRRDGRHHARDPRLLRRAAALIVTKANVRSRVHRRVYMDYVGVKLFSPRQALGRTAIVGLFTSTAYTRSTRAIPYLRRKVAHVIETRRLRSREPFGQGARQHAGGLSARRAVPDRRGHALRLRDGDPGGSTSGRACARSCGATASTASSRSSVTCRRSDTTPSARADRRLSRQALRWARFGASIPSFPEGPLARALHHRSRSRGGTPDPAQGDVEGASIRAIARTFDDDLA